MTQQLNIHETKTRLSKLIELTQAGEEFVIAKAGKPVAKLVPLDKAKPPRKLGLLDARL
jgi:prevent-host-death family protein